VRYNNNYQANPNQRGGYNQNYNNNRQQYQQNQYHHGGRDQNRKGGRDQQQHYDKGQKKTNETNQKTQETPVPVITATNLRKKLSEFLSLEVEKQRTILGELLFPLILKHANQQYAPKITGMLIDLDVLEVSEILEFFENDALLKERVQEALELVTASDS